MVYSSEPKLYPPFPPTSTQVKKEMSIKVVNILAADGDHLKDDGGGDRYLKLKSIKESLVEILGIGDFNEDEKRLLKEIKELIDI